MKTSVFLAITMTTLMLVSLGACGGGGGGGGSNPPPVTPPPPPPTGGITRNGIAFGPISTFGSIVVNGVHYDTSSSTQFTFDDNPSTESDLNVGDIVIVKGSINDDGINGTADSVSSDDDVTGPVESIDLVMNQLVVLGQQVLVDTDTSFDNNISPASLDGLIVGDIVEVHGFFSSDGTIAATRIEKKLAVTQFEVHGTVSGLDAANFVFSINALTVDFSMATLNDFPGGSITDGDFVQAKGSSLGGNGQLLATIVELESQGISGNDGDHVEVEGLITRFVSATEFDVSGILVTTTGSTVFEGGMAADLGLNIKVEVEGDLDGTGALVADKVDIRRSKKIRSVAVVDSVDAASESLVMLGITFTTDTLTRFEDKTTADVTPLTVSDIAVGDYLEIRGAEFPASSGRVLATILERNTPDTRTELQGFVDTVGEPTLSILGVAIDTTAGTVFRDIGGSVLTSTEFFALVAQGSLVKARGTESSDTSIAATQVELELAQ